jgi:hypothetical protein
VHRHQLGERRPDRLEHLLAGRDLDLLRLQIQCVRGGSDEQVARGRQAVPQVVHLRRDDVRLDPAGGAAVPDARQVSLVVDEQKAPAGQVRVLLSEHVGEPDEIVVLLLADQDEFALQLPRGEAVGQCHDVVDADQLLFDGQPQVPAPTRDGLPGEGLGPLGEDDRVVVSIVERQGEHADERLRLAALDLAEQHPGARAPGGLRDELVDGVVADVEQVPVDRLGAELRLKLCERRPGEVGHPTSPFRSFAPQPLA